MFAVPLADGTNSGPHCNTQFDVLTISVLDSLTKIDGRGGESLIVKYCKLFLIISSAIPRILCMNSFTDTSVLGK